MAVLGQDRGGTGADADAGISALALLAFLGAGNTHHSGDYQHRPFARDWISWREGQAADGNLGGEAGLYAQHVLPLDGDLCACRGVCDDRRPGAAAPLQRAVDYSLRAQNPSTGGWRYRPGDMGDTSQLGWQLMSLWSAERAGINVPPQTWTGAERFLAQRASRSSRAGWRAIDRTAR